MATTPIGNSQSQLATIDNCSICLEPIEANRITTVCKHIFHTNCFDEWITTKLRKNTIEVPCPLCRRVVFKLNPDPDHSLNPSISRVAQPIRQAPIPLSLASLHIPVVGVGIGIVSPLNMRAALEVVGGNSQVFISIERMIRFVEQIFENLNNNIVHVHSHNLYVRDHSLYENESDLVPLYPHSRPAAVEERDWRISVPSGDHRQELLDRFLPFILREASQSSRVAETSVSSVDGVD